MINLNWKKCGDDGHWCSFDKLNIENINTTGVYIVWHAGNPGLVVRIGQGDIKDRIEAHREDEKITQYRQDGKLFVTWAYVALQNLDGVERVRSLMRTEKSIIFDANFLFKCAR